MRLLTCFTVVALVGLLAAAPTSNDNDINFVVTPEFYMDDLVKYSGKHDIVNLVLLFNSFSLRLPEPNDTDVIIFFVEADNQPDGSQVDQGLYVLKDGKATKLLDNGRDAAASIDNSMKAFFGAKDGLYVYNLETNSAEKYGPITDSIIAIDTDRIGEVIYILTEDHEVYKVTDNGEKKEKLDDVVKPKQIVVDFSNNLFFFSDDKVPHVRTADGVKKIEGLPEATGRVTLLKSPYFVQDGASIIIDNKVYFMHPDGSSETTHFEFQPKALPTALAPEAVHVQYYAHDKKIYEYNQNILLDLFRSQHLGGLSDHLKATERQTTKIRSFASNSVQSKHSNSDNEQIQNTTKSLNNKA